MTIRRIDLKAGYEAAIVNMRPTLVLTLGAGRPISPPALRRTIRHYFHRVERKGLGTRYNHCEPHKRITAIGFLEHVNSNQHYHFAVTTEGWVQTAMLDSKAIWTKLRPGGHFFCEPLLSPRQYASYITKEIYRPDMEDDVMPYVSQQRIR